MSTTTDTAQLRWEIERQRSALGRDLEALGDHVSPGRIVERRKAAAGQRVRRVKDTLMGSAEAAGGGVSDASGSVADTAGSLAGSVSDGASSVAGAVRDAPDAVMERTKGSPLGMGLITFGIGLVAGSLLPSTKKESQLAAKVEPALERVAEEAGSAARQGIDQLRPAAEQAAQTLKHEATDAARSVQQTASDGAAEVQARAQAGAAEVAEQAGTGDTATMPTPGARPPS
ncbi:MAG TPA: DUF3618 domain-containing protein [Acidimicrobiales bacterium]|nr:DUF3618 domain-containing protein [Acidimicrobiales bacterium]